MNVPNPPEFRLMVLVCEQGNDLLDFTEMCTRAKMFVRELMNEGL